MAIYYYRWTCTPGLVTEIRRVADPAATIGPVTFPIAIDVTVGAGAATKAALDTVMIANGYTEVTPASQDASWGAVIHVDSVIGSDANGRRGGFPFATIQAALAATGITAGDLVFVAPGTYTLPVNTGITIPSGVAVVGRSSGIVTLQSLAATAATDLVTMGDNTRLEHFTLRITSTAHVQLRGIVFPGTTNTTAVIGKIKLTVDETGASAGGTSVATGIHITATGVATTIFNCVNWDTEVTIVGAGLGAKTGVLADGAGSNSRIARTGVLMVCSASAAGVYVGIKTNNATATLTYRHGTIDGGVVVGTDTHADISQTLGILQVGSTDFARASANALGFTQVLNTGIMIWGDPGALPAGTTFMRFGTGTSTAGAEAKVRLVRKAVAHALSVRCIGTPAGASDVFTIRKNGVDTLLVATLVSGSSTVVVDNISVSFADVDDISLMVLRGSAGVTDTQVSVNLY